MYVCMYVRMYVNKISKKNPIQLNIVFGWLNCLGGVLGVVEGRCGQGGGGGQKIQQQKNSGECVWRGGWYMGGVIFSSFFL